MNIEEFRDYCLSMDGVMEKTPFGKFAPRFDSTLVFYVLDHMFCMVDMDDFTSVSFRSNDEEIARITERYSAVTPPVNKAMKFWLRVKPEQSSVCSGFLLSIERQPVGVVFMWVVMNV